MTRSATALRPRWAALCLATAWACAPPTGDPGPGDATEATVQTWMNGEVFGTVPTDGLQWALAFYSPGQGQVCMALGLVEVDPGGGTSYENMPTYTATVWNSTTPAGTPALSGEYYFYQAEGDSYFKQGSYMYGLTERKVDVDDDTGGKLPELQELPAELTNDQLVSLLQPCHGFEASASLAPILAGG